MQIWSPRRLEEYMVIGEFEGHENLMLGYGGNPYLRSSVAYFNVFWLIWEDMDQCLNWSGDPLKIPMALPDEVHELIAESLKVEVKGKTVKEWAELLTASEFIDQILLKYDLPFMSEAYFSRDLSADFWKERAQAAELLDDKGNGVDTTVMAPGALRSTSSHPTSKLKSKVTRVNFGR